MIEGRKFDKKALKRFVERPYAQVFLIAAVLNLVVDGFSRESFFQAFLCIFTQPLVFLYNTLIIAITLIPALFFARRFFVYVVIALLWIIVGVTDFVLLQFRTTPFTFVDITMIKTAATIWNHYLSVWQLILIALLLVLSVIGCILLYKRTKKQQKLPFLKTASSFIIALACCIVATEGLVRFQVLSENFGNLADAYHSYGLPYCFMSSVLNTGISKPKKYSDEYVQQIIEAIENGTIVTSADIDDAPKPTEPLPAAKPTSTPPTPTEAPDFGEPTSAAEPTPTGPEEEKNRSDTPNIIFVQLESFFDPTTIVGSSFTEDPLPNFHRLMEEYTSGNISVPSIGAGTANTEFEVITGMNLDFFGPGEYPYKTILKETTCDSIGYVLKGLGYSTHAIHNNDGTFYERHLVFPNLGFDTFTSIEYMNNVERTPLDWAKDNVLIQEIAKTMKSTQEPDFIYTISVQGHGSYPTEPVLADPAIDLSLPEEFSEETYYQLLYYTNQIHEMDAFVAELIGYLESTGEDTVLVMYGDHLPGLKFAEEQILGGNLFHTPFVVWSSFPLDAERQELEAYQLYSYVLGRLDIHSGIINGFHQTQIASDIYLEELEILEYDMLYGDRAAYGTGGAYPPTGMQMGIDPVVISAVHAFADSDNEEDADKKDGDKKDREETYTFFFTGSGFTPYSVVLVDGKEVATRFASDSVLSAIMPMPPVDSQITVVQRGVDEQILSSSEPLVITQSILDRIFPRGNPFLEEED